MSAPEKVRLKRKRTEDPPASLVLTRAQDVESATPQKRIRYVIEKATNASPRRSRSPVKSVVSRLFHLKRHALDGAAEHGANRVREEVPTVEETRRQKTVPAANNAAAPASTGPDEPSRQQKRPGRGSAVVVKPEQAVKSTISTQNEGVASLADSMHQFALQELSKQSKSSTIAGKPRMSAAQVKDRHERRMASARAASLQRAADAMDVDGDFVYDTYVLTSADANDVDMDSNVGLLVIDEHDEDYWHELLAQNKVEEQEDSDDDENAEDHYAADYPEDELDSDDEFDRDAYRYRARAGSDDEQWDHRQDDSDNDSAVYDGGMGFGNKVSMIRRWEDDLGMRGPASYDYD